MSLKQKIIGIIVVLGIALIAVFQTGLGGNLSGRMDSLRQLADRGNDSVKGVNNTKDQEIKIISTNPSPLEETTILPMQAIEITFNQTLESAPEFKTSMEPKADYKTELSEDRKTAKIIPIKPYTLGGGYTLHILGNTKFDGKKELNREEIFHFKTINYTGV
ncbi:hypothetical protein HYW46_06835 [Candidatus Daviesbacteria bacterium]|nr:hypothetical protein [Candidatus Daviesbacteria bacterium]